jgi:hypothetical protein
MLSQKRSACGILGLVAVATQDADQFMLGRNRLPDVAG